MSEIGKRLSHSALNDVAGVAKPDTILAPNIADTGRMVFADTAVRIYEFATDNLQELLKLPSTATVFIRSQCDDSFTLTPVR